jgi:hypothetical protein
MLRVSTRNPWRNALRAASLALQMTVIKMSCLDGGQAHTRLSSLAVKKSCTNAGSRGSMYSRSAPMVGGTVDESAQNARSLR